MNSYVKRALHSPSFMILLCLAMILVLIPIFAPQLAPHDPLETNYAASMVEHSAEYPLGTDQIGTAGIFFCQLYFSLQQFPGVFP